jgi:signal transduction histidine kinase
MQRKLEWLEREHAIEKERTRIAKDIHDELGSSLTRIMLLGQRAREESTQPEKSEAHAGKIVTTALATVQSLDEIVWAVDPKKDTLNGLVGYLNQYTIQFFDGTEIRCWLEMPVELPVLTLPAEVRHDFFLVAKEALNNVLKHSHASEVWVCLTQADGWVTVAIEDNGRGFDPNSTKPGRKGNGLENMSKRIERLGGEFRLDTAPGRGTRLEFSVKVS